MRAKKIDDNKGGNTIYEVYADEVIKDINGKDVIIPTVVARCDLEWLEERKVFIQNQIDAIKAEKDKEKKDI